jgi:CheY-like chemotaxis protein
MLLREALRGAFERAEEEAVIFEAMHSRKTKQFVEQQLDADLIVLDLNLPDRDGFSAEDDFPRGADFGMNPSAQRSSARTALSRC